MSNDKPKAEPEMRGKRVLSSDEPSTTIKDTNADNSKAAEADVADSTRKHIEKQKKVEVYIPRSRGPQTIQINGENFTVPAGVKVEVAEDLAGFLQRSGALDLPPGY